MMFEPVNPGWSTPAWGEFGAWRVQGRHIGIDYYVPRGTPLFASGDGTVEVVSFHSGGHGHFIIIRYATYRVSVSHMLARSPLSPGDKVTRFTRIGTVGQTGNAEGIQWNDLIHPHVEVRRLSNSYIESPRNILKPFDRNALAGGGTTPIPEREHIMGQVRVYFREEGTPEWSLMGDDITSAAGPGFQPTADRTEAQAWIAQYGEPFNVPTRSTYVNWQTYWGNQYQARQARVNAATAAVIRAELAKLSTPTVDGSFTDADRKKLTEVRAKFA